MREVRIPSPKHNYAMALSATELLGRGECDCPAADDDHHWIVWVCHVRALSALAVERVRWIPVPGTSPVFDHPLLRCILQSSRAGRDWHFSVAARNVEYVSWLTQSGDPAAQRTNETLSGSDPRAEVRRAAGKIGMMKIIRLNPHCDEAPEQGLQYGRVVINTTQQDRLR